ncbi:unknown [Crocosphaera subtropica ATCC 51142]|uniref:Uncharacterized protein n=1 Tax=Crocosphaera subtropica (strain ATCC 51142 / BH68) TaxID=43989 RepID=B1WRZ5_CROS5|nr:unknown [Crocosphaera subtropica ATCC 51142]
MYNFLFLFHLKKLHDYKREIERLIRRRVYIYSKKLYNNLPFSLLRRSHATQTSNFLSD